MDDSDPKLRRAAELIHEAAGVALAVSNPLSFGRKLVELLLAIHRGEPLPGLPAYFLDWLNDIGHDLRAHQNRLFALESDRGKQMVTGNLGEAAWREASDARRRMLGDAVLGVIISDLTTSELSRAERTIRMLDPEDLDLLRELADPGLASIADDAIILGPAPDELQPASVRRHKRLEGGHLSGAALIAAGCVRTGQLNESRRRAELSAGFGGDDFAELLFEAELTAIGELVIRFMGAAHE